MNNSTEPTSNIQNSFKKNKSEINIEELVKKPEPKLKLIAPSFVNTQPIIPQKNFDSIISDKNNYLGERFNSFCSFKSQQEYDNNLRQSLFPTNFKNYIPIIPAYNFPSFGFFNSHMSNDPKYQNKIDPNNFKLNSFLNDNEDFYKEKKENKIYPNLFNYNNKIFEKNWTSPQSQNNSDINNIKNNININQNEEIIVQKLNSPKKTEISNSGTKFFTNHNYGYKCSCSKTQCNRKYCECFNSGNYCVDCNCKNCNNKPPINSYTNKHPVDEQSKTKKEKIICTCTKSGCNKNYCECYKIGQKCSSLCRCIGCENNDQILNKKYNSNYQCNLVNSIYIIKNKLYIEDIKRKKKEELFGDNNLKHDFIGIYKKRKREENNNEEEKANKIKKVENNEDVNLFNDSLFDKNGKVILRHINLFQI